ncbi:MAG: 4-hydroxy-tetrahydrodipicolinate reductase [Legionellales bacterium]|nr:MAG: 4-hydroxy-tetrahydrodipicolinate reductase [Legionellales bacterium]
MIKVLVSGAYGRMGSESCVAIAETTDLSLVAKVGSSDDLAALIKSSKAQVVVDFSVPDVAVQNARIIINSGAYPVIGTSGFTLEDIDNLQELVKAKQIGGIIAPNFSIAVALMLKYSQDAYKYLPQAEIIEMHHDTKLDKPSGTALKTAQILQQQTGVVAREIPIHAIRLPGVLAEQQVIFGGLGETLTIQQRTIDRKAFMPGVVIACNEVLKLKELVYGLEFLL